MNNVESVVIFCGGKGSRLSELTGGLLPKPMVKIGHYPIIWHLINFYRLQGIKHIILCTGHLYDYLNKWFSNLEINITKNLIVKDGKVQKEIAAELRDLTIELIYTGDETMTASRLAQVKNYIRGNTFFMTYGDGLSDVNLRELFEVHKSGNYLVTITGVSPLGRFGEMEYDETKIIQFSEKPFDKRRRINGGFMCADKSFIEKYLSENDLNMMLENRPFNLCAQDGRLGMHLHDGYWQCMDNPRDYELLCQHANSSNPPWILKYD
jgi:glucose-1-phosphate cytidylyltransferase